MFEIITFDDKPDNNVGTCSECKFYPEPGTMHEARAGLEQHARDEHMGMFTEPEHRVVWEGAADECGLPLNICPHYAAESPAEANQPSEPKQSKPATLTKMKEAPRVSLEPKFRHVTVHVPIELALNTD